MTENVSGDIVFPCATPLVIVISLEKLPSVMSLIVLPIAVSIHNAFNTLLRGIKLFYFFMWPRGIDVNAPTKSVMNMNIS